LDLSVILTTFSDWSDPDLYMSAGEHPTPETAQWKSDVWGMGSIVVPSARISPYDNTYYILSVWSYSELCGGDSVRRWRTAIRSA
jgi:hypothetical protein